MLMMPLPGPSRPGSGPTDADDARLAGFSRPGRGPTDADDALVGALTPRKRAN